ncbi:MAG: hypothetical protein IPP38_08755 [Bacteroidetes bacterium]|nr:hypothetical protein [Bacteroidota bacterium]
MLGFSQQCVEFKQPSKLWIGWRRLWLCSNALQGISAGYVDIYSKTLDGMWINILRMSAMELIGLLLKLIPTTIFVKPRNGIM